MISTWVACFLACGACWSFSLWVDGVRVTCFQWTELSLAILGKEGQTAIVGEWHQQKQSKAFRKVSLQPQWAKQAVAYFSTLGERLTSELDIDEASYTYIQQSAICHDVYMGHQQNSRCQALIPPTHLIWKGLVTQSAWGKGRPQTSSVVGF